jgi:hypothetical protein
MQFTRTHPLRDSDGGCVIRQLRTLGSAERLLVLEGHRSEHARSRVMFVEMNFDGLRNLAAKLLTGKIVYGSLRRDVDHTEDYKGTSRTLLLTGETVNRKS